jgi:uncharacterized protein YjiS (DUF1127 family)
MAFTVVHHRQGSHGPSRAAGPGLMKWLGRLIKRWRSRVRERRPLALLDPCELNELGSSRRALDRGLARRRWDR